MSRFIYFVEGLTGSPSREAVARAGNLHYAFQANESFSTRFVAGGDLGVGVLAASGDGELAYKKDAQEWRQIRPRVWMGLPRDKSQWPGHADLARKNRALDGYTVRLADGQNWLVPIVRFLNGDTQLPRILTKVNGEAVWSVKPEYDRLVITADRMVRDALDGHKTEVHPSDMLWFAAAALGVNYCVGEDEIAALGLIDSENVQSIAGAAMDSTALATLLDQIKKKVPETSESGPATATGVGA